MSEPELKPYPFNEVDDDECILVKVLDKSTKNPIYSFNSGYYRSLPEYPLELMNIFVDFITDELKLEIFHISGNQVMTYDGLFVVTEKRHLDMDMNHYEKPERFKRKNNS